MGGVGSGPRPGDRLGMEYWTAGKRERLAQWEAVEARRSEERRERAKGRARMLDAKRHRDRRERLKAEGRPLPRGGKEPSGASTPRVRRWKERQRLKREAAAEAVRIAHKAELAEKRKAAGLERIRTNAEKQAAYRERQKAKLQAYWFSPALEEVDAKAIIQAQYPDRSELQVHFDYVSLLAQAQHANLNVNSFMIAADGVDGIQKAQELRAIFSEIQHQTNSVDFIAVLKAAEAVAALKDLPQFQLENKSYIQNALIKSKDYARTMWGTGELVYKALTKEKH